MWDIDNILHIYKNEPNENKHSLLFITRSKQAVKVTAHQVLPDENTQNTGGQPPAFFLDL